MLGFATGKLTKLTNPENQIIYICGLRTRIECEREVEHSTRK